MSFLFKGGQAAKPAPSSQNKPPVNTPKEARGAGGGKGK